ncbi:putative prophage protein [Escherichia coli]|uniref:Putative prophage protein n=1 Tax=Escherichia coli TaxID=562 RepID=A0A2X3KDK5_ECOLX|nr:putative prophage protein [Escherichia coli]
MNTAFALVLTVFLVSESQLILQSVFHRTMQGVCDCSNEQKIPGNCLPVDKVIHQDNNEIRQVFKTVP